MDILLIIAGALCLLVGLAGCILPALPGPPVSYIGLLLLHFTGKVQFTAGELWIWLAIVVVIQVADYVIPMLGSKYIGGSKWGTWGAFVGSVVGLFFIPLGLILGPFIGALAGELLGNRSFGEALRSGIGALLGFIFGTVLKVTACVYFIVVFVSALF